MTINSSFLYPCQSSTSTNTIVPQYPNTCHPTLPPVFSFAAQPSINNQLSIMSKSTKDSTITQDSRPNLHSAATIIPTISSAPESPCGPRARASTSPDRQLSVSFANLSTRRRAQTNFRSQKAPLHVNISSSAAGTPAIAESPIHKASDPIDIPPRKKDENQLSSPSTPLTARVPQGTQFSLGQIGRGSKPRISESLTPYYSTRFRNPDSSVGQSSSKSAANVQRGFAIMGPRAEASLYRPTSSLSPSMPVSTANNSCQKARAPGQSLKLPGFPRFHPANFPSRDASPVSPSNRSSRSITSQPRPARGSDAQQKLLQYQRELVTNATKASRSLLSSSTGSKPSPPRLTPLRSPGGPMTPLMLEGQGDYLVAGASSLPSDFQDADGRELVERLVRRENERRTHPEARSGSVSPALSPALSPAVSPAGGRV